MNDKVMSPIDEKAEFESWQHITEPEAQRNDAIAMQLGCWVKQDPYGDVAVSASAWLMKPFVWGLNVCASDGNAFVRVRQRAGLVWACVREVGAHELTAEAERVASGAWRAQWKRAMERDRCAWLPWPTRLYHADTESGESYATLPASIFEPTAEASHISSGYVALIERMTMALGEPPCWYRPTDPSEHTLIMPEDSWNGQTCRARQAVLVYWGDEPRRPVAEAMVAPMIL